ncbi:hypothetical protein PCANC_21988 [Puccinia coronata f. sp. avenae]|uniref:Uncharacterized protein n=1 Tax=Puccinia coronata f. sp. avenae TaxID=200324 RepID=A0A2N5U2M1_9BASI|nr:hypothetical protein PCANC_21988 [Puccinia coronata f. sp. avenae]
MAYSGQLGWLYWDINSIAGRAIESAQPDGQAGHQVVLRVYLAAKPVIKEYTTMATMVASEKYKPKASLPTGGLVIELLNDRSRSWSGGTRAADGFCHPHGPMLSLAKRFCARQRPNSILAIGTAGINRSNTAVRAVLKQPCSTGGWTGTVRPKHLPAGRTGLSDQFLGPVAQDQPGPVGQICPTSWLSLRSDSVRPTTGRTRLFKHCSSSRV